MAPVQPKRPVGGAYGIFLAENRAKFTKATEGQPASAVSKMCGAEWKKLSEAQQKPFQKTFEDVKAKYEKDLEAFLKAGGVVEKGTRAKASEKRKEKDGTGKKKKDLNAPKRPAGGAFGQWLNENREAIKKKLPAGHKITDVTKQAGKDWAALKDAEKKPYEAKFQKLNEAYKKAIAEYRAANAGGDEDDDEEEEEEEEEETPVAKKSRKAGA